MCNGRIKLNYILYPMANIVAIPGLVILLIIIVAESRTIFSEEKNTNSISSFILDDKSGICKSMITPQGYVCEEHKVTTKDGYILSIQRMPQGRSSKSRNRIPVFLQHGLLVDGITWLLNSPNESLAFILADNGYDVWIANTRGTTYSRGHTSLDPSDKAYWNWSWDELVNYDLPATVSYVHDQTGQKPHYVGHSLGTLIAFASFSKNELINMIRSAVLLSPIAHMSQMSSLLARASVDAFLAEDIYWLGVSEFAPGGNAVTQLLQDVCELPDIDCADLMTALTGPNCCVNSSQTDIFLKHEPQSTATKNLIHMAQMVRQGTIAMYDYGSTDGNNQHYGQPNPPAYDIASIPKGFPLYLSYGGQDYLSDVNDVQTLLNTDLQEHDSDKLVLQYIEDYAHGDFVFGIDANKLVYDPLMAFLKLHSE